LAPGGSGDGTACQNKTKQPDTILADARFAPARDGRRKSNNDDDNVVRRVAEQEDFKGKQ
jgi:hypothetical protein